MSTPYRWVDHRVVEHGAGGRALLFGAEDASLFALDAPMRDVLSRWSSRDVVDLDEAPPQDREALEALRDARVLAPAAKPARGGRRAPHPSEIPLGTLVLEVAQACNLRCTYCYAGGGSYGAPSRLMQPEVARRAARFLVESSGERKRVTLVLFGGEPLLNLPAMQAAVIEAQAAASAAGKELAVSLTTNGTRFTPPVVEFLRAHRIALTVSIDGPPQIHDANRRYAGGGGTYDDVVAGLEVLRAHRLKPPAARVTLNPPQWPRIPEVFAHLLQLGFAEVGIAPATPVEAALLPSPEQENALFEAYAALADAFRANAAAGRVLPFSNLIDLLARLHAGHAREVPCGAGLGYLAADASGRFFLCHRLAGTEAFAAGSLDDGIDHARISASLDAQAATRREACAACWARTLCAGGCHHDNHVREARLGRAPGGSCDFIRRWLDLGIRVYADVRRDADERLLALLAARAGD
jgi:uncharacterized protein